MPSKHKPVWVLTMFFFVKYFNFFDYNGVAVKSKTQLCNFINFSWVIFTQYNCLNSRIEAQKSNFNCAWYKVVNNVFITVPRDVMFGCLVLLLTLLIMSYMWKRFQIKIIRKLEFLASEHIREPVLYQDFQTEMNFSI